MGNWVCSKDLQVHRLERLLALLMPHAEEEHRSNQDMDVPEDYGP